METLARFSCALDRANGVRDDVMYGRRNALHAIKHTLVRRAMESDKMGYVEKGSYAYLSSGTRRTPAPYK